LTRAPERQLGPVLVPPSEPAIQWRDYDRIEPGTYPAYCRWAKQYRDLGFHRWTCLLRWDVLANDLLTVISSIPMWLPLGNQKEPWASRRGKYLKEWVSANGGPPARDDRLSPRIFTKRIARVEVGDTDPQRSPVPYSVVRRIVTWETGPRRVPQSASHTIKDGIG
jgi:hypothetical protein